MISMTTIIFCSHECCERWQKINESKNPCKMNHSAQQQNIRASAQNIYHAMEMNLKVLFPFSPHDVFPLCR